MVLEFPPPHINYYVVYYFNLFTFMSLRNLPLHTSGLYLNTFRGEKLLNKVKYLNRTIPGQVLEVIFFLPTKAGLKVKSFIGVCLSVDRRKFSSSFLVRNSYRSNSIESRFFFYSPLLLRINFLY